MKALKAYNPAKYIRLALLFFCAQTLASPFLNCCDEEMQAEIEFGADLVAEPHLFRFMVKDEKPCHSMLPENHQQSDMEMHDLIAHDCSELCDFCLSYSKPVLSAALSLDDTAVVSNDSCPYLTFSSLSPEGPFRPPIVS